jgi:hypothetical protein
MVSVLVNKDSFFGVLKKNRLFFFSELTLLTVAAVLFFF